MGSISAHALQEEEELSEERIFVALGRMGSRGCPFWVSDNLNALKYIKMVGGGSALSEEDEDEYASGVLDED
ncbi:uncharacterized protein A4U43_C03F28510 [Asparagus officinalis]|uniref:Uncharacterized protein n=1 Tax=Asparagus officinalis TaxID=4686 RepID=A0A5P1FIL6_ASPOF|nr:uncharacterized protein A4U43_C03F28510 [Asparagus officinalis]